jgi:hypothetical protein
MVVPMEPSIRLSLIAIAVGSGLDVQAGVRVVDGLDAFTGASVDELALLVEKTARLAAYPLYS